MTASFRALVDSQGSVFGYTDAPPGRIDLAGAVTADGAPVNVRSVLASRAASNVKKIDSAMPSTVARTHNGQTFYILVD